MEFVSELAIEGDTRIVLVVVDGLGGLPDQSTGLTELEASNTPNLDVLAADSVCGLLIPVGRGITPGSGPAHIALFGYDPLCYLIGRGVLGAIGAGVDLEPTDVAARVNFCTVENGLVTDRRAGRLPTEENARLCALLNEIVLDGAVAHISPEKDYRAALVLKGRGISPGVTDTDPQRTGLAPLPCEPVPGAGEQARNTARLVNEYVRKAREILADRYPANMIVTRGFSCLPDVPAVTDLYKMRAACVASYPMYRAVGQLVGMDVLETGEGFEEKVATVARSWSEYDYFFIHHKPADSAGEDGDAARKMRAIEEVDRSIAGLLSLDPDVIVVTGDHSTPTVLRSHSWHPLPLILKSRWERPDDVMEFGERSCAKGGLGAFPSRELMALLLANALRLEKFGA
ncbi:MAG: 2,3-bisphosphoglycerate-independent phosphoglycerate mutase [Actinomycetota bacterium]